MAIVRELTTLWRVIAASLVLGSVLVLVLDRPQSPHTPSAETSVANQPWRRPWYLPILRRHELALYVPALPSTPGTVVLSYDDFGSSVDAYRLLGRETWSWPGCVCFEPDDEFNVRVVVYRGRSLASVTRAYPAIENVQDYRHVTYDDAMTYLDDKLAELRDPADSDDVEYRSRRSKTFAATRARITSALGER